MYKFNFALPSLVKIYIKDVNDIAPYFPESSQPYEFSLLLPPIYGKLKSSCLFIFFII